MISGNSGFRIDRYRCHRVSWTDLVHRCKGGVLGQHWACEVLQRHTLSSVHLAAAKFCPDLGLGPLLVASFHPLPVSLWKQIALQAVYNLSQAAAGLAASRGTPCLPGRYETTKVSCFITDLGIWELVLSLCLALPSSHKQAQKGWYISLNQHSKEVVAPDPSTGLL